MAPYNIKTTITHIIHELNMINIHLYISYGAYDVRFQNLEFRLLSYRSANCAISALSDLYCCCYDKNIQIIDHIYVTISAKNEHQYTTWLEIDSINGCTMHHTYMIWNMKSIYSCEKKPVQCDPGTLHYSINQQICTHFQNNDIDIYVKWSICWEYNFTMLIDKDAYIYTQRIVDFPMCIYMYIYVVKFYAIILWST